VPATERLRQRLLSIPGVAETRTRFGTRTRMAWRVGTREIAHMHAADVIDIRVPATLQKRWRGDPRLTPRPRRSDWIECRCASATDLEFAAMLVEIAATSAAK
jgi:hypothetical protein